MPVIRKKNEGAEEKKTSVLSKKKNADKELNISLPTKKSIPSDKLGDYTWLIYGAKKIGKTSLASQFPDALGLMFEPGGKALEMFQMPCPDWNHLKKICDLLEEESHDFQTCVVDTGSLAYDRCLEYVCLKNDMGHPSDEGFGKGWNMVSREFQAVHSRLMNLGTGTIILCHDKIQEVESRSGRKYQQICPHLSGGATEFYTGIIDTIGFYHYEGSERWLQIRGDDLVVAGTRLKDHFLTPEGKPIFRIPMGSSEAEAFENIVKAFNNEQELTYHPDGEDESDRSAPKLIRKKLK